MRRTATCGGTVTYVAVFILAFSQHPVIVLFLFMCVCLVPPSSWILVESVIISRVWNICFTPVFVCVCVGVCACEQVCVFSVAKQQDIHAQFPQSGMKHLLSLTVNMTHTHTHTHTHRETSSRELRNEINRKINNRSLKKDILS